MGFEEETFPANTRHFISDKTQESEFNAIFVNEKEEVMYRYVGASGDDRERVFGGVLEGGDAEMRSQT